MTFDFSELKDRNNSYYLSLGLIVIFCLILKLPSLQIQHNEMDEVYYSVLANKLLNGGNYSLQGTDILTHLDPTTYDKPLFHHPPLFIYAIMPLLAILGHSYAVIVSWFAHITIVVVVFLFLKRLSNNHFWATILGTLAVSLDPVLTFTSHKIWIDTLLAALCITSLYLFYVALSKKGAWLYSVSGVVMGLAIVTKVPAVLVLPAFPVLYLLEKKGQKRLRIRDTGTHVAVFGIPLLIVVLPWFISFYQEYGVLIPNWTKPTSELIEKSEYIRIIVNRPWNYYLKESLLMWPFCLLILFSWLHTRFRYKPIEIALLVYVGVVFITFTILGALGNAFLMRFLTMLIPAIYILWGMSMRIQGNVARALSLILICINSMTVFYYVQHPKHAAVFSFWKVTFG